MAMRRRHLLASLGTAACSTIVPPIIQAAEATGGKWTKQWIVKYAMSLVEWVKEDFAKRASEVVTTTQKAVPLNYQFKAGELDRKEAREHQQFLDGRLSDRQTDACIAGYLKDLEEVMKVLASAEAGAFSLWKDPAIDAPGQEQVQPMISGKIFGANVEANRLGVILDNSPSMKPYVEKLRAEIGRDFATAHIVEVNGCLLHFMDRVSFPWFYSAPAAGMNPFAPERHCPEIPQKDAHLAWYDWTHDLTGAFLAMVNIMKVDAIYWFCDFDDHLDATAFARIAKPMQESKIKLFAHTVKKGPPNFVIDFIKASGGDFIRKTVR